MTAEPTPRATPRPWRIEPLSLWIVADNVPKGPMHVADVRGWGYLNGKGHGALGLPDDEALAIQTANAAHIVLCVNHHERLVEALKEILAAEDQFREGLLQFRQDWEGDPLADACDAARAIIADLDARALSREQPEGE